MTNLPLITVICISYNHEEFIVDALESVINQTYKNVELIIADDCSKDNSDGVIKDWLKKNPKYQYFHNATNLGNTKTFNIAKKVAKGGYILDLAADDFLELDCLEILIEPFLRNDKLGIVYANSISIDKDKKFLSYRYDSQVTLPPSGDIYETIVGQKIPINSVASLVKTEVFERLNAYDENLMHEDIDLWIRASRIYPFEYVDKVVVQKRDLPSSLGNQFYKPFNKRTKKINYSTYLVIRKAITLNKTKSENKALLKRLHFEMNKAIKTYNLSLFLKYIPLELKLRFNL